MSEREVNPGYGPECRHLHFILVKHPGTNKSFINMCTLEADDNTFWKEIYQRPWGFLMMI